MRFLAELPLCQSCSWQQLLRLGQALRLKKLRNKELALRQGDVCHQLCFVYAGKCRRFLDVGGDGPKGEKTKGAGSQGEGLVQRMQLARLSKGEVFGEGAVLDAVPRRSHFSIEAEGEAVLLTLSCTAARSWQGGSGIDPDPLLPFGALRELRLLSQLQPAPEAVRERFFEKHEWKSSRTSFVERLLLEMCETKMNASRRLPCGTVSPRLQAMHTELSSVKQLSSARGPRPSPRRAPPCTHEARTQLRGGHGQNRAAPAAVSMPKPRVECYSWDDSDITVVTGA